MCKRAAQAGLSMSMFERLRLLGIKPFRLQVRGQPAGQRPRLRARLLGRVWGQGL
jgi:hypothetical protein